MGLAAYLSGIEVRVLGVSRLGAGLVDQQDPPADGSDSREFSRIFSGKIPGPVTAHGKPSQINSMGIAVKLLLHLLQSGHGDVSHGGIRPPDVFAALRHNDDGRNPAPVSADRCADANLGLDQAVVSAFPGAMKKEDHGPFFL